MKTYLKLLVLPLMALLIMNAGAISISTAKTSIERGDVLSATGTCNQDLFTKVQVFSGEILLLESDVSCDSSGVFSFSYNTTFLDQTGKWALVVSDGAETSKVEVLVNDAREAGFFLLRFLSPTPGKYVRTETISLSVEVSDSGRKVDDANVAFFGFDGKRHFLKGVGSGVYTADYEIPADANLGSWGLEVFAESIGSDGRTGGRNKIPLQVDVPPIKIQIVEPSVTTFEFGEEVKLNIVTAYFNGKSLEGDASVTATINETKVKLIKTGENTYEGKFTAPSTQSGTLELLFEVEDGAGNKGTQVSKLVIGCSITCLAKNYGLFVLLAIIIIIAVGGFIFTKVNTSNQLGKFEEEKRKTLELIKSLQEDYFTKGVMPSSSYKKNLSDYKAKVAELEEKIAQLKSRREQE